MAEKKVQVDEGASASSSTSFCSSCSAPVAASSSTSSSVSIFASGTTSASSTALALLSGVASASTSSSWPKTLRDQLPIKLEGVSNLPSWKEQVEYVLVSENLTKFVSNTVPPTKYSSDVGRALDFPTVEYRQWAVRDRTVRTWLLSSISEFMHSFVMGWEHAWQVWSGVHELCRSELVEKIKIALRKEMKNTKKGDLNVIDYICSIGYFIDTLVELGDDVPEREQIDAILDGLPEEYQSLRRIIHSREDATVSELESLMIIQEMVVNKFQIPLSALVNLDDSEDITIDSVAAAVRGRGRAQRGGRGLRLSGHRRLWTPRSAARRGSN